MLSAATGTASARNVRGPSETSSHPGRRGRRTLGLGPAALGADEQRRVLWGWSRSKAAERRRGGGSDGSTSISRTAGAGSCR